MTSAPSDDHRGEPDGDRSALGHAVISSQANRQASLHALHVLEYALAAPAPRRQRTWLHRVTIAVDALAHALEVQIGERSTSADLLSNIAVSDARFATRIERLRQEELDLRIAVTSLREQIEPDPEMHVDPADVRDRLATLTRRYRHHRAREADLVYEATDIDVNLSSDGP